MLELISDRHIKAVRKKRCCLWCKQDIEVGQPAVRSAYRYEGDFQTAYYHPECLDAMAESDLDNPFRRDGWSELEMSYCRRGTPSDRCLRCEYLKPVDQACEHCRLQDEHDRLLVRRRGC